MVSIKRHEDLDCYKLAVEVRRSVLRLTRREAVRRDFQFTSQIRDSARGAPRNISEGFGRFNPPEILPFLSYAKSSLLETKNHIVDGRESGYFTSEETEQVLSLIRRTLGAIRGWREYLESPAARRFYEQYKARIRAGEPVPETRTRRRRKGTPQPGEPEP